MFAAAFFSSHYRFSNSTLFSYKLFFKCFGFELIIGSILGRTGFSNNNVDENDSIYKIIAMYITIGIACLITYVFLSLQ